MRIFHILLSVLGGTLLGVAASDIPLTIAGMTAFGLGILLSVIED